MHRLRPTFRAMLGMPAMAISGAVWAASPAAASTLSQTATIPLAATDWSTTANVGQFDPSLGNLQDISFGLTGMLQGSIGIESLDPAPTEVYGAISSTIALSAPGAGQVLSVAPYAHAGANVGAFDGNIDFAGASGRNFSGLSATQSATTTYTVGAPGPQIATAPFVGTGTVALPVSATASAGVSGPLDLAARTQAAAGASVTVKYGTGPAAPGGGGAYAASGSLSTAGFSIWVVNLQHTTVQTRTMSDQNGDWARNVSFDPFNPALGTLVSADLTLSGDVKSKLSLQDTGPTAGSYSVLQSALFNLEQPNGTLLGRSEADSRRSGTLDPFGRGDNFAGPFGVSTSDAFLSPLDAFSLSDMLDLALFSGPDPLSLAVDAITTLAAELPGSADLLSSGIEGAQITLSYTYLPPGVSPIYSYGHTESLPSDSDPVPEPGSLAMLGFSLASFVVLRRRSR